MKRIYSLITFAAAAMTATAATPTASTDFISLGKPTKVQVINQVINKVDVKSATPLKKAVKKHAPEAKAVTSVEDMAGEYVWDYSPLLNNMSGSQEITITVSDASKGEVEIAGIAPAFLDYKIKATVDMKAHTLTIPNGQYLGAAQGDQDYFYVKGITDAGEIADGKADVEASVGTIDEKGGVLFDDLDIWAVGDPDNESLGWWAMSYMNEFIPVATEEPVDPMEGWEVYCTGKLQDGWIYPGYDIDPVGKEFAVEIHRSTETAGLYRVFNPYKSEGFELNSVAKDDGAIVFDISDPEFVQVLPAIKSGMMNGASAINCFNVEGYYVSEGYSKDVIINALGEQFPEWSTYENNVVTIPNARVGLNGSGMYVWNLSDGSSAASLMVAKITFDKTPVEYVIAATGITLDMTEVTVKVGETFTLTATVEPENADDKTVVWASSDELVATVNAEGAVTAVAEGTATITATCGAVSATCTVTVEKEEEPAKPVEVIVIPTEATVKVGETFTVEVVVKNPLEDDDTITWTSSDESVATVSAEGVVTAVAEGTATITATYAGVSATCTVTVVKADPEPEMTIALDKTEATLTVGETLTLTAKIENPLQTDEAVTWSSTDEAVATVDSEGVVTAVAEGTATIIASYGGLSALCQVTVVADDENLLDEIKAAAACGELYDLQGRRVNAQTKGIVIVRKGNKVVKALVK